LVFAPASLILTNYYLPVNGALESNAYFESRHTMIIKLDNSNEDVGNQIFKVFQNSYKVEAQLINAYNFPPLSRSSKDIKNSETLFYGFYENGCLAGVIEIVAKGKQLAIDSLTVDPKYFRKGIAGQLISYILDLFEFTEAIVETAVANDPAINLYKKYGFVEFKQWTPAHGIRKVAMSLKNAL
jgi:ribosomal protein S18 acetylase RimI-like enzyme